MAAHVRATERLARGRRVRRLGALALEPKHGIRGVLRREHITHGLARDRTRAVHQVVHRGVVREARVEHLATGAVQRGFAKPVIRVFFFFFGTSSVSETVAAAFIGAVGETRVFFTGRDATIEGNALGNLGRGGGPLVLVRGGLKRRLRALWVDHGRRASLGEPRDGGTGSGGGSGRSVVVRRARRGRRTKLGRVAKCRIVAGAGTNEDVPA